PRSAAVRSSFAQVTASFMRLLLARYARPARTPGGWAKQKDTNAPFWEPDIFAISLRMCAGRPLRRAPTHPLYCAPRGPVKLKNPQRRGLNKGPKRHRSGPFRRFLRLFGRLRGEHRGHGRLEVGKQLLFGQ